MKIVTIIPLTKGVFKENLTYFTSKKIEIGAIVSVLVRNRKILGLVTQIEEIDLIKKLKLKTITGS